MLNLRNLTLDCLGHWRWNSKENDWRRIDQDCFWLCFHRSYRPRTWRQVYSWAARKWNEYRRLLSKGWNWRVGGHDNVSWRWRRSKDAACHYGIRATLQRPIWLPNGCTFFVRFLWSWRRVWEIREWIWKIWWFRLIFIRIVWKFWDRIQGSKTKEVGKKEQRLWRIWDETTQL